MHVAYFDPLHLSVPFLSPSCLLLASQKSHCLLWSYLIGLHVFSSTLVGQIHLEMYPFLLSFPVYLNIRIQNIPSWSLDFIGICCDSPFFFSSFINLGLFSPTFQTG
jgi:hypothetical protein